LHGVSLHGRRIALAVAASASPHRKSDPAARSMGNPSAPDLDGLELYRVLGVSRSASREDICKVGMHDPSLPS
jgi:hypothetical protein